MAFQGIRIELGQCLLTEYGPDGFLRAQPDGLGASPKLASYEVIHPFGLASRPRLPDVGPDGKALDGGGCAIVVYNDGTDVKIEFRGDHRALAGIPPLAEGSSVQYAHTAASTPSFDTHSGKDGTKQIYVEVGDSAHIITVGLDGNGDSILELVHARGMALTFLADGAVLKNRTGNCYVELTDDGGNLNGNWKVTGAFDIGATSFPLVKFPPLSTQQAAVQNALTLIGVALTNLAAVPVNSPAAASCGAAVTGITAALAALATFNGAGPTLFTKGS